MLDTFKVRLKAKSTAAGANLSQKRIDALADRLHKKFPDPKDEAEHDTAIDSLYDATDLKEFAQVDDYQRTKEAKEKKDKEEAEKKAAEDARKKAQEGAGSSNDEPAWFKAYREKQEQESVELKNKIGSFEKEKTQGSIKQKLAERLKELPANYWSKRAMPEKEEDLEAFVTEVQTDYKTDFIEPGLITNPGGGNKGGANSKASKSETDAIVNAVL